MLVLYETRKMFGARTAERFLPAIALFELAYFRFLEREAREEAVRTLEDVTQRVHGDYERATGRARVAPARRERSAVGATRRASSRSSASSRRRSEDARRALRRADAVEATVGAGGRAVREGARRVAPAERVAATEDAHDLSDRPRADARRVDRRSATARRRTARARRRRHARAAMLADAAHARTARSLYLAAARGIAPGVTRGRARRRWGRASPARVATTSRADARSRRRRCEDASAASRSVLHDGIVHQLSARLPRSSSWAS